MKFLKNTFMMILITSMLLGLVACGNNEPVEEPDEIPSQGIHQNLETENTIKNMTIDSAKIISILESIDGISGNFETSCTNFKSIQLQGEKYEITKTNTVLGVANRQLEFISDGFQINVITEFYGNSLYPNSLSITMEFASDDDIVLAEKWSNEFITKIFNSDVAAKLSTFNWNSEPIDGGKFNSRDIKVYRVLDNMTATLGKYMTTYYVAIDNTNIKDTTINDFSPSSNPKYILFNTGLISYTESIDTMVKRIAKMYHDTGIGTLVSMSDMSRESLDENIYNAKVEVNVSSNKNGTSNFVVNAYSDNNKNTINMVTKTLIYKDRLNAFYAAEDLITNLTGVVVELDEYFESDDFSISLEETGFNESWGYPINITGAIIENVDNSEYSIALTFTSKTVEEVVS